MCIRGWRRKWSSVKGCCATRIQIGQPCWRIMSSPPSRLTLINIAARVGCEDCTANVGGRERGGACISFVSFGIVEDDEARSVEKGKRGNRRGTTPQVKMTPRRKATTQDCSNADALMVWKLRQERTCNSRNLACINLLKDTQSAEFGVEGFTCLRIVATNQTHCRKEPSTSNTKILTNQPP
jgi:hypothetical protein